MERNSGCVRGWWTGSRKTHKSWSVLSVKKEMFRDPWPNPTAHISTNSAENREPCPKNTAFSTGKAEGTGECLGVLSLRWQITCMELVSWAWESTAVMVGCSCQTNLPSEIWWCFNFSLQQWRNTVLSFIFTFSPATLEYDLHNFLFLRIFHSALMLNTQHSVICPLSAWMWWSVSQG